MKEFIDDTVSAYVAAATAEGFPEDWDLEKLWSALKSLYPISFTIEDIEREFGGRESLDSETIIERVMNDAQTKYSERENTLGGDVLRELERKILLSVLDRKWREHLYEMDYLQEGIGLRAMAQRDPLVEYQKEGFELFSAMMDSIAEEMVGYLFNVEVSIEDENVQAKGLQQPDAPQQLRYTAPGESGSATPVTATKGGEVSRNAPCPCGSGKKYKRCHGSAH